MYASRLGCLLLIAIAVIIVQAAKIRQERKAKEDGVENNFSSHHDFPDLGSRVEHNIKTHLKDKESVARAEETCSELTVSLDSVVKQALEENRISQSDLSYPGSVSLDSKIHE